MILIETKESELSDNYTAVEAKFAVAHGVVSTVIFVIDETADEIVNVEFDQPLPPRDVLEAIKVVADDLDVKW